MRTAVVGHVEWVQFVRVPRIPATGDIIHAENSWEEPGGGGPGAAVQLQKLAGECHFFTALGDDDLGHRAAEELTAHGVATHVIFRPEPTRRAITHIDSNGERTITVIGERLGPHAADPLPWGELADTDAVYFTAGDPEALVLGRRARVLVATSRALTTVRAAGIALDALVGSAVDPAERYENGDLDIPPGVVVRTRGEDGGTFTPRDRPTESYPAAPPPGPIVDRYGAGDAFAAGLTYGLGAGMSARAAVEVAARCGAAALTGRGPFGGQLTKLL